MTAQTKALQHSRRVLRISLSTKLVPTSLFKMTKHLTGGIGEPMKFVRALASTRDLRGFGMDAMCWNDTRNASLLALRRMTHGTSAAAAFHSFRRLRLRAFLPASHPGLASQEILTPLFEFR